ncbi:hypothetical protein LRH25_27410 [Ideonella azotifigens]|uniref:Uncharacterized protein n=1 Tax=Ideonella azotifigens TaxID=513160 RepID=A0ABN1KBH7_9BURK|nr:hypothetical protein [Ideonella azotifigens]MCD2344057.1 hypothetical protein [Ideonella azotifigens]
MIKKFATAAVLAAAMGAAQAYIPSAVSINGTCDTFVDLTTEGTQGAAGTWVNSCTGFSIPAGGAQVRSGSQIRIGYVLGTTGATGLALSSGHEVTWWLRDDGSAVMYNYQGVAVFTGTWTATSPK